MRGSSVEVEEAARRMRRRATRAEAVLWQRLRRDQVDGLHFRRQHPVGRFILDFFCASAKLGIEVDGAVHDQQRARDAERTAVLEAAGYRILRVRNEDVLEDLEGVVRRIRAAALPTSSPRPESGEGSGEGARPPPRDTSACIR